MTKITSQQFGLILGATQFAADKHSKPCSMVSSPGSQSFSERSF